MENTPNPWTEKTHPMHLAVQQRIHDTGEAGIVYERLLFETGLKRKTLDTILEQATRFGGIEEIKLRSGKHGATVFRRPPYSAESYNFVMADAKPVQTTVMQPSAWD